MPITTSFKEKIANFFGGLGYLSCIVQWLWSFLLFFEPIKDYFNQYIVENTKITEQNPIQNYPTNDNPIFVIIMIIIVAIVIVFSIFVIIKYPAKLASDSKKIVHQAAQKGAPIIIKTLHEKPTKKRLIKLTWTIIILLKVFLITLPIIAMLFSKLLDNQILNFNISLITSLFFAFISILLFCIEYLIAYISKTKIDAVW